MSAVLFFKNALFLHLLWRQIKSNGFMFKVIPVRSIAKRFVGRQAAAAQGDLLPAAKIVHVSVLIHYFKISLNYERAVVVYRNFCCRHFYFFLDKQITFLIISSEAKIDFYPHLF